MTNDGGDEDDKVTMMIRKTIREVLNKSRIKVKVVMIM